MTAREGVDVVSKGPGVVELHWVPGTDPADVRAVAEGGLATSWVRVEAYLPPDAHADLRVAARAGLRREGLLRGIRGVSPEGDRYLYARLADDPAPDSRLGFSSVLDTTMPSKRVIAQGVLRDRDGRVLVCETTYKRDWDLPGGIVDPDESPAVTVTREAAEELGVDLRVGRLLAVNWMPRYYGWSDALQLVYDLGVVDATIVDTMTLSAHEIAAVHWLAPDDLGRCAPYEARVITEALRVGEGEPPADLADGIPRER